MCIKPSPRILWSWGCILLILLALLTAGGLWLCHRLFYAFLPFFGAFMGVLSAVGGVYLVLRRHRMCFTIGDESVSATTGVWITTNRHIPLAAVRQVSLLQGPIERWCGIAYILVNSTGGYLLIEGIELAQAEVWCHRLTQYA